jgi:hypothetical protein
MVRANIVKAAWLAILLGLGMEVLLVAVSVGFGNVPDVNGILANLAQRVSWSFIVCVGLAVGTGAAKARQAVMGMAGVLAAPAAFHIARIAHKSAAGALGVAGPAGGGPSPEVMALLKAVEYGVLGAALGQLAKRAAGPGGYFTTGLLTGLIFAAVILWLAWTGGQAELPALVSRGVNEILFPIGCALVLYSAEASAVRKAVDRGL